MNTIAQLIKEGKVRYAGVCNYNAEQLQEAQKYVKLVSNQVPYSMVKRNIEEDVVPYCMENHLSILAYSPLERGLLTGKMNPGYKFTDGDHRASLYFFKDENIERTNAFLEKLKPLAKEKNAKLSQLVIRWTIEQRGITVALVGARNAQQAVENARSIEITLTKKEIDFITEELDELRLVTV